MPFRGGQRGRGGRGRRGRGGHGRSRIVRDRSTERKDISPVCCQEDNIHIDNNVKIYFSGNVSFDEHYKAQETNRDKYAAALSVMMKRGVDITQNAKIRALSAAWARGDSEFAKALLSCKKHFGFLEVFKSVSLLDSGRNARVTEKKLKRLQLQNNKVNPKKMGKIKSDLDNLNKEKPSHGSASGSVCKHVKHWVRTLSSTDLEFFALHFPLEPWKKLADICHFHPQKDFKSLPWFLPYCFGTDPPEHVSFIKDCRNATKENVNEIISKHRVPITHVKAFFADISNEMKGKLARDEPKLDTILWYYEDLKCSEVDNAVSARLSAGETVTMTNGKLLERLLTLKLLRDGIPLSDEEIEKSYHTWDWENHPEGPDLTPKPDLSIAPFIDRLIEITEKNISDIKLHLDAPIVIMGDRSPSMEIAIRTSSIIAGALTAITSAKLVFFDEENMEAPFLPSNIPEVLNLASLIEIGSGTAPVASLIPFYVKKEVVKTFIIVTDEEENTVLPLSGTCDDTCSYLDYMPGDDVQEGYHSFATLFKKYHDEVYPARLVFVSFIGQHEKGSMVEELKKLGIQSMQFKFDKRRPDLSKLDTLFALLSMDNSSFEEEVEKVKAVLAEKGVHQVLNVETHN